MVLTGSVKSNSYYLISVVGASYAQCCLQPTNDMPDKKSGGGATPDWKAGAENGVHLWSPYSTSEDCYLPETHCTRHGHKHRCSVCKIIAHGDCIPLVLSEMKWHCRLTFREVKVRNYREDCKMEHHWVQHRYAKGKCGFCSKSLQPKKLFTPKDLIVTTCSWCKKSYHNRDSCFNSEKVDPVCDLGRHGCIIVPPTWILKLENQGDFKSSLRSKKPVDVEKLADVQNSFIVKPIPSELIRPVIVFINPKSGGNQGVKLLQKFQWLLNPRQVFDLTQGGPNMGLELFKRVPNLRVLACGGDGTVGWVLSVIDRIGFSPPPAVGVLPLGTGNDLARALGWGGGYTDEPISKILTNIGNSEITMLDRWKLRVEKNPSGSEDGDGKENLPLDVVNNYFSLGVDAHIALEFHQAREAHPEKFNSRLRNKMFYGQRGGKDLLKRKWKALSDYVTLTCDGTDYTPVLKEHKFHAIVFLNIPSYGGGTRPWPKTSGSVEQSTEDGMIEVVGLTTFQLPLLQAGGHGDKICQCKTAEIVTTKTIPMQVDGEACKLNPSIIKLELLNKAAMLAKKSSGKRSSINSGLASLKVSVHLLKMADYEQHYHDKNQLIQKAIPIGELSVLPNTDLEQTRSKINDILTSSQLNMTSDWCFIDSCTAERFFRIDRAQENVYYVTDIGDENLYILEPPLDVSEVETASPSPSSDHDKKETRENPKTPKRDCTVINNKNTNKEINNKGINKELIHKEGHSKEYTNVYGERRQSVKEICRKMELPLSSNLLLKTMGVGFRVFPENRTIIERSSGRILEAAKSGDIKKLRELHSEGFSLLSKNPEGETALHLAAYHGQRDVIKYLLTSAPPQIINVLENKKGHSALHKAVLSRRKNICCMLVAAGASLTAIDNNGKTAKDLSSDPDITAYLETQEQFVTMTVKS